MRSGVGSRMYSSATSPRTSASGWRSIPRRSSVSWRGSAMTIDLLAFAQAVASGAVRVIDLTQTLSQEFPTIVLPPELGQCAPFRIEEVSRYDERAPAW